MLILFGTTDIKHFVKRLFESIEDLSGKVVIDIPAGSGYISDVLRQRGAAVQAFDLFPEFFKADGIECVKADLTKSLPIETGCADYVLCQEGIEHLPNQLFALQEFGRILKPEGSLILTTPNISHLRAKLSNLLVESDLYKRLPANELDEVWHAKGGEIYFGHLFLIGIQKLRALAKIAGFRIKKINAVRASYSSLLLGVLFYPIIILFNIYAYFKSLGKRKDMDEKLKKITYDEIFKLNLHPTILFGKHLFIEFEKHAHAGEIAVYKEQDKIC